MCDDTVIIHLKKVTCCKLQLYVIIFVVISIYFLKQMLKKVIILANKIQSKGKSKKDRKTDEEVMQIIRNLRLIDDVLFEKFMEDSAACEELLQVILENPQLKVKSETLVAQKSLRNLAKRSVRLDAYIEGREDKVYNIEIQRSDNCNHVKRVRYNASTITVNKSEPGDEFEHVQDVIVVYISEFDMFGAGKTVYHVENVIRETGEAVKDGLMAVYVNTEVKEDTLIGELMQCFLETDFEDNNFPNISRRMKELKHGGEDEIMCKSVEEYAEKKAKEATENADKRTAMELSQMGMDIEKIANALHRDVEEIKLWLSK